MGPARAAGVALALALAAAGASLGGDEDVCDIQCVNPSCEPPAADAGEDWQGALPHLDLPGATDAAVEGCLGSIDAADDGSDWYVRPVVDTGGFVYDVCPQGSGDLDVRIWLQPLGDFLAGEPPRLVETFAAAGSACEHVVAPGSCSSPVLQYTEIHRDERGGDYLLKLPLLAAC